MADAWHELQNAIRALRKQGDIRVRLAEAYRHLDKVRLKDLPSEVRQDHDWLYTHLHPCSVDSVLTEIRTAVERLSAAQLSEAVHRIVALHTGLQQYQPPAGQAATKRVACNMEKPPDREKPKQLELWNF
ncbi:hypothetical protein [Noviherbaspirillum saxi]|uniref:Uncharacterized protein n=1 Tax=Noviherbaspirillum saxi TaxID=2320863 RepID=A0A3A3FZY7_9BURK|nr:hypothetical protein [Noviherbaspirillum saxi]RJF92639.1 hypothetical protein D3871_29090 [Noviherbaspirillum saxi]